jgi:hypothetical protein
MWPGLLTAGVLATVAVYVRPVRATEARPTYRLLAIALAPVVIVPMLTANAPWTPTDYGLAIAAALGGGVALLYWWNARVTVVGRWCERRNILGRVTARGYIAWTSARVDPLNQRFPRVFVTLADKTFFEVDGEWRNARGLYEAMKDAKCASEPWPEGATLFGWRL